MERLLARLERRLGRYAIPNLIVFIVGGMAMVWLLSLSKPEFPSRLTLDMGAVRHGEVWRLVTFLFIPPPSTPLWILLNLYFTWWVGSSLDQHWGAFKFNAYYFVGAVATIAASVVAGPATNVWLDASLFLAFATVFPDVKVLLLFIVPISVKWLGLVSAVLILFAAATGGWATRAAILAALFTYVLFFGEIGWKAWRQRGLQARQKIRNAELTPSTPLLGQRVCAICGASEVDGVDIRVCSCEKCGGSPRSLCLAHARSH